MLNKRRNLEGTYLYELHWESLYQIPIKLSKVCEKILINRFYTNMMLQYLDFTIHLIICSEFLIRIKLTNFLPSIIL